MLFRPNIEPVRLRAEGEGGEDALMAGHRKGRDRDEAEGGGNNREGEGD